MIELYVTQTRTYYPDEGDVEVHLYGRTEDGEADVIRVTGFEPYFYVDQDVADEIKPRDHTALRRVEEDADTPSLGGGELAKIVATHPGGVPDLRDQYGKENTYEADVVFTNRLRIDKEIYTGVTAPRKRVNADQIEAVDIEAPVRYCYYDIEIDDRNEMPVQDDQIVHTDSEVVTIVAYDNFLDEYHGFLNLDGREPQEVLSEDVIENGDPPGCIDKLHPAYTEKQMLKKWFQFLQQTDPDLLLAWNNLGFDAPYLIERIESIGLDAAMMARGPDASANNSYGPELSGRVVYDLMKAWKRMQYSDVSKALDNAASMELDDAAKIEHEESLYTLWKTDVEKLLRYNGRDVSLMVEINDAAGVMDDREELKNTVGVDYEGTYESNDFIEMLARRKLHEWGVAGPTKTPPSNEGDDDYEGALTLPAFEGRRNNVTSIDLSSLYPYTMWMLNSSPEKTVAVYEDGEAAREAYESGEHDDKKVSIAPNGAMFSQEEDGLFKELVNEALELTKQAGRRRDQHNPGSAEWERWNQSREARKRIRNGLYGVLGWVWFFLYDEPVAESVTTMAQQVTRRSADYVNAETDGNVIYGDTDSCYISWPDSWSIEECLNATESVVEQLNNTVYPELAAEWGMGDIECKWEMEIEDASETMFQAGAKKRYAKKSVWKEGMEFDARLNEPEYKIVGFEYKRSDCAPLLEHLQKDVFKMIVDNEPASDIRQRVFEAAQKIERRYPDWDLIGVPGGIGQSLDSYDSDTAQVRGAKVANRLLDSEIDKGQKPQRVYLEEKTIDHNEESERPDVICYNDGSELNPIEDQLYVNTERMKEVVIQRPMGRILDCLDIDVEAAMRGEVQNSIADYV